MEVIATKRMAMLLLLPLFVCPARAETLARRPRRQGAGHLHRRALTRDAVDGSIIDRTYGY